jgi:hypothetical protein
MPYARRDAAGRVVALTLEPETGDEELLDVGHPDVVAFLRGEAAAPAGKGRLSTMDADMARVVEDLIDILVQRRVLMFTDLPPAAQRKLLERRRLREQAAPAPSVAPEPDDLI